MIGSLFGTFEGALFEELRRFENEMDQLLASGEVVSIALFAMAVHEQGEDAISFTGPQINLVTDDAFMKARIQSIDAERIHRELGKGRIVVVAGFQGVTPGGEMTVQARSEFGDLPPQTPVRVTHFRDGVATVRALSPSMPTR